jgi:hypothetical protein
VENAKKEGKVYIDKITGRPASEEAIKTAQQAGNYFRRLVKDKKEAAAKDEKKTQKAAEKADKKAGKTKQKSVPSF